MSIRMTSGACRSASSRASPAQRASSVRKPLNWSTSRASFKFCSLSSTISTSRPVISGHTRARPRALVDGPGFDTERQREAERAACAWLPFAPDVAAMQLNQLAGECKSQPAAFVTGDTGPPSLHELSKNAVLVLDGDAYPVITYVDLNAALHAARSHGDLTTGVGELHRVR